MRPSLRLGQPWRSLASTWGAFLLSAVLLHHFDIDFAVADRLFQWEGGDWTLQHHVVTETLLHRGGRILSELFAAMAIGSLIASVIWHPLRDWRRPLSYLVIAVAVSTLSIAILKHAISMDCPWDLARYGGDRPFIGLFEHRPADLPDTACFPAGHASAGYAWLALYFFLDATRPRWRWFGLALGLTLGLAFGLAQQLRGAHFLSHDLWTLMLCWTTSMLLSHALLRSPTRSTVGTSSLDVPSSTTGSAQP